MNSLSTRLALAGREMTIQLFIEVSTRARRNLESLSIPHQLDHIARTIQNGAAMSAIFKMGSHAGSQVRIDLALEIIGNLTPYLHAIDFDRLFRQVPAPIPTMFQRYQMHRVNIWKKNNCSFDAYA